MTDEEKEEMWSNAQTREAIIDRSGTKFNSGVNPELAMRDAQTRLQTGGGLFGNDGLSVGGIVNQGGEKNVGLWYANKSIFMERNIRND